MKKFIILLIVFTMTVSVFAYGHGTLAGSSVSNMARVSASNLTTPVTNSATVTVRTQAGGYWNEDAAQKDIAATVGGTATWTTTLTNLCNFSSVFTIKMYVLTNGNTATVWTNKITTDADTEIQDATTETSNDTTSIAPATDTPVTIAVVLAGDAIDDDYMEYAFYAIPQDNQAVSYKDIYTGDNGLVYGGTIGTETNTDWAGVGGLGTIPLSIAAVGDGECKVTCSGPVLTITHSVLAITNEAEGAGFEAGAGSVIGLPGATVIYLAYVTNEGSSSADNLEIVIPVAANLALEAGSDRNVAGLAVDYSDGTDDAVSAIAGTDVICEPGGTAEAGGDNDGSIANGTGYSCMYKVIID